MQLKNDCTRNSQYCTWLCLVQLLDCYSYNYSLIARKYMRLPIQIAPYVMLDALEALKLMRLK